MVGEKSVNILVADNGEEWLEHYTRLIRELDDEVVLYQAGSGRRALEILASHDIDAAMIDIELSDVSGFELAEWIRGQARYLLLPIVFIGGEGRNQSVLHRRYHHYEYIRRSSGDDEFRMRIGPLLRGLRCRMIESASNPEPSEEKHTLMLRIPGSASLISVNDILFAEIANRRITLHTNRGIYSNIRMSLQEFIDYVNDASFRRTYKSFAANINRIEKMTRSGRSFWSLHFAHSDDECLLGLTFYRDIVDRLNERVSASRSQAHHL